MRAGEDGGRLLGMRSQLKFLRRGVLVTTLFALLLPVASAYAEPTYEAEATVSATEDFTYAEKGAPEACRSWTEAIGTVSVEVHAVGEFVFFGGRGGAIGRFRNRTAKREAKVEHELRYRRHVAGFTADCSPCGPSSEYGECVPPTADQTGEVHCDPAVDGGRVGALLAAGRLNVWGIVPSGPALRECTRNVPAGVPVGSSEPELEGALFSAGTGRIARLAIGESVRFHEAKRTGSGCKPRKGQELEVCIRHEAELVIKRVG